MKNIELVDRDSEQVEDIDTSITRGVTRVIKLTETTIDMSDSIYNKFLKENNKDVTEYSDNIESKQIDEDTLEFTLTSVEVPSIEETHYVKTNSKAIKESEAMINNTDMNYSIVSSKATDDIDVNEINKEEIVDTVEKGFDFYNINQSDSEYDAVDTYEIDDSYEESTLDNLVNSHEKEINGNEKEKLGTETKDFSDYSIEESIIPEIKQYFSGNDDYGIISDNEPEISNDEKDEQNGYDEPLYEEIANSIEDENVTIGDLNELSQKLSNIISKKQQLTSVNEELNRERDAAVDELNGVREQQQEAEKRKAAIIREYNSMVNNLQHENDALEETTNKVQEEINDVKAETEKIKSDVTATEKYSSGIIEMLSDYGYGTTSESLSEGKAKAA